MRLSVDGEMNDPGVWLWLRGEEGTLLGIPGRGPGDALSLSSVEEEASIVVRAGDERKGEWMGKREKFSTG